MQTCSNCGKSCIPNWRALVNTTFTPPIFCPCCDARLIRRRRALDLIIGAPLLLAVASVQYWDIRPAGFIWFYFGFATASGVLLWLPFVVFETIDDKTVSFLGKGTGRIPAGPD